MWTDTRNCVPLRDDTYLVQNVKGDVMIMMYTFEGGWNSYYDSEGELHGGNYDDKFVARWFDPPKPEPVPKEWYEEWLNA